MIVNVEAINRAIEVMRWVQAKEKEHDRVLLDMARFQKVEGPYHPELHRTADAIVECGTTCCFSGWLAVHPLFPEFEVGSSGEAIYLNTNYSSYSAAFPISDLLGVPVEKVHDFIFYSPVNTAEGVIRELTYWRDYL